jgi:hypothetical protein
MKKTKFSESQILGIFREQEQGKKATEICLDRGANPARKKD